MHVISYTQHRAAEEFRLPDLGQRTHVTNALMCQTVQHYTTNKPPITCSLFGVREGTFFIYSMYTKDGTTTEIVNAHGYTRGNGTQVGCRAYATRCQLDARRQPT